MDKNQQRSEAKVDWDVDPVERGGSKKDETKRTSMGFLSRGHCHCSSALRRITYSYSCRLATCTKYSSSPVQTFTIHLDGVTRHRADARQSLGLWRWSTIEPQASPLGVSCTRCIQIKIDGLSLNILDLQLVFFLPVGVNCAAIGSERASCGVENFTSDGLEG